MEKAKQSLALVADVGLPQFDAFASAIQCKLDEAKQAKAELGIHPLEFPTYSHDLNPYDFALWDEVERRMDRQRAPEHDTAEAFKQRLRNFSTSKVVKNVVGNFYIT